MVFGCVCLDLVNVADWNGLRHILVCHIGKVRSRMTDRRHGVHDFSFISYRAWPHGPRNGAAFSVCGGDETYYQTKAREIECASAWQGRGRGPPVL